jgi:TonB family protein
MSSKAPKKKPPAVRERTQNFLLYGFALSILLHLLIGPLVQFKRTPEAAEPPPAKVTIQKMPTPPPTPKPTPKPTPTPPPPKETPPPKSTPEPAKPKQIKINTLKTNSHTGGPSEAGNTHTEGSTNGVPQGSATGAPTSGPVATPAPPTPTPVPTPTPIACAVPNADARTINAVQAETPAIAQQQGITGEVTVQVSLDETSKLVAEKVVKSPSALLNNAALAAARQSTFKTRIVDCKPVADSYFFVVDFQSQ